MGTLSLAQDEGATQRNTEGLKIIAGQLQNVCTQLKSECISYYFKILLLKVLQAQDM